MKANKMLLVMVWLGTVATAQADTVSFDYEPLNQFYGTPVGQSPGDPMFAEGGALLFIDEFLIGGSPYFNYAQIDPPFGAPQNFGSLQILETNNVTVRVDFSAAGDVILDYLNLGGSVNLEVNGAGLLESPNLAGLAGVVAPGVFLNVSTVAVGGGIKGVAHFTGPVEQLRIGGQEFWIDSIACDNEGTGGCPVGVDHQSLAVGTTWGAAYGTSPGDHMFTEDGIPVWADVIDWGNGGTAMLEARVEPAPLPILGFDRVMHLNNFSNVYEISALAVPVIEVTFEYVDLGGMENLQVNGATLHIGDLHTFPAAVAPGVTMSVVTTPVGIDGLYGQATLTGDVQTLLLGGQEFWVDNVCVYPQEDAACDLLSPNEDPAFGTMWGGPYGETPGDHIYTEDGIEVRLFEFDHGLGTVFNTAYVATPWAPAGAGQVLHLNNICVGYDLAPFGPLDWVRFEYCRGGGVENLEIDGLRYVGDLTAIPAGFFPGLTVNVAVNTGPGYQWGTVTIVGPLNTLLVGGQEFYVDNLCVMQWDPSAVPMVADGGVVLEPNYPNPFNPSTTVRFNLARDGATRLVVFDLAGRRVATLLDEHRTAGEHEATWTGRNDLGRQVGAGMYLLRLESGGGTATRKITMVK
ncbi:MAG: T9SS type A sorting domain-containing protein [bacterium]|nr:T9SS type A sorting domain-containing protein [bacterium]